MEIDEGASSGAVGLAESIKNELEEIITVPYYHNAHRVPSQIKKLNPEAYKPRVISVGPVFHGLPEFQPMEVFKKRYAKSFIEKYDLKIQDLINVTKEWERRLRLVYGIESSEISCDELVRIMIIDGAFLVEFLLRYYCSTYEEIDRMTHTKWNTFTCDLFLLENQIPYSYLHSLFHLVQESEKGFVDLVSLDKPLGIFIDEVVLPQFVAGIAHSKCRYDQGDLQHFIDFLRTRMQYKFYERDRKKTSSSLSCPTISQLHRAGIKFRASPTIVEWSLDVRMPRQGSHIPLSSSYDAVVNFGHGILEIPCLKISETTKRYFANLLAVELHQNRYRYATDYIAFMDYLIDDPEDVKILVESGILQNFLNEHKAVAEFFNEIGRSIDMRPDFLYSDLVENLNAHCKQSWIKWKSTHLFEWKRDLKRNYFSNPWKTLSVIAAIILLGLTVIQTVCSLLGLN